MKGLAVFLAVVVLLAGCGGPAAAPSSSPAASVSPSSQETPPSDPLPRMVMVDGVLYQDTGRESPLTGRCGTMDGEITSAVEPGQQPSQDGQSNFGAGYGCQRTGEGVIELSLDGKWILFREAAPETVVFNGESLPAEGLSPETLDWLCWYNLLPREEQLALSYIPGDLLSQLDLPQEDAPATQDAQP